MHKDVHRYLELEKIVDKPDFFSRALLVGECLLQPLGHILFWLGTFYFPEILAYFGSTEEPSMLKLCFYAFNTVQVFIQMITSWSNMIEFYHLGTLFLVTHIKLCRTPNPFIIKSSTPSHQLFKYSSLLEHLGNVSTEHTLK
jgi:hypothetical protein